MLEVDSKKVLCMLKSTEISLLSQSNIYFLCRELLQRAWNVSMGHVYREANFVADELASIGLKLNVDYFEFPGPPEEVI